MKRIMLVVFVSLVVAAQGKLMPGQIMPASWSASLQYGKRWTELLIGASDARASEVSLARASERLGHPCPYARPEPMPYHFAVSQPQVPVAVVSFKMDQEFGPDKFQLQYDASLKQAEEKLKKMEFEKLQEAHVMIQKKMLKVRVVPNPA